MAEVEAAVPPSAAAVATIAGASPAGAFPRALAAAAKAHPRAEAVAEAVLAALARALALQNEYVRGGGRARSGAPFRS